MQAWHQGQVSGQCRNGDHVGDRMSFLSSLPCQTGNSRHSPSSIDFSRACRGGVTAKDDVIAGNRGEEIIVQRCELCLLS